MKEKIDVLIFSGQSNMVGETEGAPETNEEVAGAYEYRYKENALTALKHPVGENLFYGALEGSVNDGGSLVPAFCRAYIARTGKKVVAVQIACGSTTIAEWLHGTRRHYWSMKKVAAAFDAIKEKYDADKVYFVWLQGESDALIQTSEQEYYEKLIQHKNELKKEIPFEKFCLIKVGYFASEARWIEGEKAVKASWDEEIQRAQEKVVATDKDFVMLTRNCPVYSRQKERINPNVDGHYNNATLDLIGTEAGEALADIRKKETQK